VKVVVSLTSGKPSIQKVYIYIYIRTISWKRHSCSSVHLLVLHRNHAFVITFDVSNAFTKEKNTSNAKGLTKHLHNCVIETILNPDNQSNMRSYSIWYCFDSMCRADIKLQLLL